MRCEPGVRKIVSQPPARVFFTPLVTLLLAVALSLLNSTPTLASPPSERSGWMAGMGFLIGSAKITSNTNFEPDWLTNITPQWRFGRMLVKNRLLLSIENKQWTAERGNQPSQPPPPGADFVKYQIGTQIYGLALTAFPGNPDNLSGGFLIDAGFGPAVARVDTAVVDTLYSGEDPAETVAYEWGWGYFVGGGYEYRFLQSAAAGLTLNYIYTSNKGTYIEKTNVWALAFTLNWYFK